MDSSESSGSFAGETLLRAGLSHELVIKILEFLWTWPTDHEEEYDWSKSSTPAVPATFDGDLGDSLDGEDVYNNVCFKSPFE